MRTIKEQREISRHENRNGVSRFVEKKGRKTGCLLNDETKKSYAYFYDERELFRAKTGR